MKKSIFILALGGFGIITTEFSVIGILPVIAREFQISIDTAGWLLSGFALTVAATGPFMVFLTSKINRKWLMSGALSVFVLSNILSAMAMTLRNRYFFLHGVSASEVMNRKGLDGIVRASVHYYNTEAEIEKLCSELRML